MYDELVKDLREKAEFLAVAEPLNIKNAFAETMKEAADAIEELSRSASVWAKRAMAWAADAEKAEKAHRWIPASEPPKKPKNYPHCELRECYFLVALESTAVVSCAYDFENNRWRESFKVTHWMPLPEPPKEEA